jgi:hypothetical protein
MKRTWTALTAARRVRLVLPRVSLTYREGQDKGQPSVEIRMGVMPLSKSSHALCDSQENARKENNPKTGIADLTLSK